MLTDSCNLLLVPYGRIISILDRYSVNSISYSSCICSRLPAARLTLYLQSPRPKARFALLSAGIAYVKVSGDSIQAERRVGAHQVVWRRCLLQDFPGLSVTRCTSTNRERSLSSAGCSVEPLSCWGKFGRVRSHRHSARDRTTCVGMSGPAHGKPPRCIWCATIQTLPDGWLW